MATISEIAYRYATALLGAAEERNILPRVRSEIEGLQRLITESTELVDFLVDRGLTPDIKQRILSDIFQDKLDTLTMNFIHLAISKRRERFLPDILTACRILLDERDGIATADITSAVILDSDQETLLKTRLENCIGKHIRMNTQVNPDLIGGFVVRVGDLVFDASLVMQLRHIRHALVGH